MTLDLLLYINIYIYIYYLYIVIRALNVIFHHILSLYVE